MRLLASGFYRAMVAPKAVGLYLAKEQNIKVDIIYQSNVVSPVAIAIRKDRPELHAKLSQGIKELQQRHAIKDLYQEWLGQPN